MIDLRDIWKEEAAKFLQAKKRLPHADHILGSREMGDDVDAAIRSLTERIGPIAHMRQIHGDRIVYTTTPGMYEECDALYTDSNSLWLGVKTADCLPLLISTPEAVAAVHCGWRGLEKELLPNVIHTLQKEFSLVGSEIFIHVGPAIKTFNYEVDESFKDIFAEEHFRDSDKKGKCYLDLRSVARRQAMEAGVPDLNFYDSNLCTYDKADVFFSYRKRRQEGKKDHKVQLSLVRRRKA